MLQGFFWSKEVLLNEQEKVTKVDVSDINGNHSIISVHQFANQNVKEKTSGGCRNLYFFCKAYLLNESPYDLVIK
jgi:vacuolar protein sorting-associated protein 13A/C